MSKGKGFSRAILSNMGWPLFWGAIATVGYYLALQRGLITNAILYRYTAGHPVEFVEVGMFFVGLMFLLLRGFDLLSQAINQSQVKLPIPETGDIKIGACGTLIAAIEKLPSSARHSYLGRRIVAALGHVNRQQSADQLDEELKYLAESDSITAHDSYAFVRIIIWATPMLGFLGTVIGITLALGDLSPEALVNSANEAMKGLLAGLSVAFDTTALALTLSIVLMFAQFVVNQFESQLLASVDRRIQDELGGRFEKTVDITAEPHDRDVVSQALMRATEKLAERQSEIWTDAIRQSQDQWCQVIDSTRSSLNAGLSSALEQSVSDYAATLRETELTASERMAAYWDQIQNVTQENARTLQEQQQEMARQTETLRNIVDATQQITVLETALNQNLKALAGAKNFEDTVMTLSATINLLSTRLGPSAVRPPVHVERSESEDRAA